VKNDTTGMSAETRRVWWLLVGSWVLFTLLAILNALSVSLQWYCR
jgi:hypothetical protein